MNILKYLLVWNFFALLGLAALCLAVYLGSCFVYLDWTPENITFDDGEGARLSLLLFMLTVSIFSLLSCHEANEKLRKSKTEEILSKEFENFKDPEMRKLIIENMNLKREVERLKENYGSSQNVQYVNKGPSAVDIAVGVGTGIVGAEIVSNIFDL